ncbi:MAG: major facilitator superfamily domain-containing protein [Benniella sp.]|nr:MAG: major facilitator superfamily domain-containing protein [Benniella sp.]
MKSEVQEHNVSNTSGSSDDIHERKSLESSTNSIILPPEKHRLFWIFIVNKEIGYLNLISYLLACFLTICLVVYLSIVQPFVLTVLLNTSENLGNLTGSLALYDEIIALPATLLWGILSDRIGRRPVYSMGFICLGSALILYSYVKNVYPQLLLCRLLFSLGSAACTCMMTGTLGDVAGGQRERGRVSAIVGMFSGFGALVSGMVLLKLPYQLGKLAKDETEGIQLALTIVGGVAIGMAVIFAFTMPNISARRRQGGVVGYFNNFFIRKTDPTDVAADTVAKEPRYEEEGPKNPFKLLKYGVLAGRDPRVALAYFSSFVARADTVLFTSYVSLWVVQHYVDQGWCRPGRRCDAAAGDVHPLTGMGQGLSLAFAPIFGFASEKFKRSTVLAVAGIIGAVGSLPFAFTKEAPAHKSNYAFVCLIGIGQIGMIVTGMTLVNGTYIDPKYRGSVAGVFSFCGAISIMIMAKLGGYLFDVWMRGAPFVLMGIAHLLVAVLSIYVRIVSPKLEKRDREMLEREEAERKENAKPTEMADTL